MNFLSGFDNLAINYQGIKEITSKRYFVTITTRKKISNPLEFRRKLYKFLSDSGYEYPVQGYMEYHNQKATLNKLHCHCILFYGVLPKNNKNNFFSFRQMSQIRPENERIVQRYITKELEYTREKATHDLNYCLDCVKDL